MNSTISTRWHIGAFALFMVFNVAQTQAANHLDSAIFNIRPENKGYLQYIRYENRFDSATVSYTLGEIRIIHNGERENIYLATFPHEFDLRLGSEQTGIDTVLQFLGRTESFQLKEGTIDFHRDVSADRVPCLPLNPGDDPTSGGGIPYPPRWEDRYWYVGINRILDQTEFVLQIVRDSDNSVLGTFDSVGVLPNPSSAWVSRYGTEPDPLNISRAVPAGLVGTKVYLRISPRRYGITPFGLYMNKVKSWISYSTLFERTPWGEGKSVCSHADMDTLNQHYFRERVTYSDEFKLTYGRMPRPDDVMRLNPYLDSLFMYRYYTPAGYGAKSGRMVWLEKDSLTFASEYWGTQPLIASVGFSATDRVHIESVSPNPVTTEKAHIRITGLQRMKARDGILELYTLLGDKVATLWSGAFSGDVLEMEFNAEAVPNGVYMLSVQSHRGVQLAMTKVIIHKK